MLHCPCLLLCPLSTFLVIGATPPSGTTDGDVSFQRDIRPILSEQCFQCHGPDEGTRQAEFRLDTRSGAFAQLRGGRAIVPGDLEASLIYQRITHHDEMLRMPPFYSKKKLTDKQLQLLKLWIKEGGLLGYSLVFPTTGEAASAHRRERRVGSKLSRPIRSGPSGGRGSGTGGGGVVGALVSLFTSQLQSEKASCWSWYAIAKNSLSPLKK